MVYTGNLALQLMSGVIMMVSKRSLAFSMFRALIMAGTAHAKPLIIGITLLPLRPTLRISLSVRKLIRAMYPESSRSVINPKRIIICGIKIRIPLRPASIPFTKRSLAQPSGNTFVNHAAILPKLHSIASMGYCANQNIL